MTSRSDDFDRYARSPETWALAARRNWIAAELLFEHAQALSTPHNEDWERLGALWHASYLHAGLAVENAAKRILILRDPTIVGGGKIKKGAFGSRAHALVELVALAHFPTSPGELRIVAKLEQFVVWAGKYGAPLGSAAIDSPDKLDLLRNSAADEPALIRSIVARLLDRHS